jgi:RNA polymerase sigma-70 factor (ECF subfamily)
MVVPIETVWNFEAVNEVINTEKVLFRVEDVTLVDLVRRGHREAFDEIDRRYRGKLCRFLARHTASPEDAEEIAQQTLVKAFQSIDSLRQEDRLAGWLYQIAFRLAVDESRKSMPIQLNMEESVLLVDRRTEESQPIIDSNNLWATAEQVLTPDEYGALWLKYVDGYKIASIAKIMGRTRISVRVLLFRARKKLLPALSRIVGE